MSDDTKTPDDKDELLGLSAEERAAMEADNDSENAYNVVDLHKRDDADDFDIDEIERAIEKRTSLVVDEESLFNVDDEDGASDTTGQEYYDEAETLFTEGADDSGISTESDEDEGQHSHTEEIYDKELTDEFNVSEANEAIDNETNNDELVFSDDEENVKNKKNLVAYGLVGGFVVFLCILGGIGYSMLSPSVPDAVRGLPKPVAKTVQPKQVEPPTPKAELQVAKEESIPQAKTENIPPLPAKVSENTGAAIKANAETGMQDSVSPVASNPFTSQPQTATPENIPSAMVPTSNDARSLASTLENQQSSKSPISAKEFAELQSKTRGIEDRLRELNNTSKLNANAIEKAEENTSRAFESLMARLTVLQQSVAELNNKIEKNSQTSSDFSQGRLRLGQFNVLNVNRDGTAVAHAPSGNRITLKAGETVGIGPERLTVNKVIPEHDLVLIGDKWFIDIKRDPIGPEERALRRELQTAQIEQRDSNFVSVGTDAGKLSYSEAYEVRAVVQNKAMLHNCATKYEQVYTISDAIPGHGVIRSIRANEVVTDVSVFKFDACFSTGG